MDLLLTHLRYISYWHQSSVYFWHFSCVSYWHTLLCVSYSFLLGVSKRHLSYVSSTDTNLVFPTGDYSCHWQSLAPVLHPLTPICHSAKKDWVEPKKEKALLFNKFQVMEGSSFWKWKILKRASGLNGCKRWNFEQRYFLQVQPTPILVVQLGHLRPQTKPFLGF